MTTESLYVESYNLVIEEWDEVGASPWLNDSTANYIHTSVDNEWHEEFSFADHVGSETINAISLYMEIQGSSGRNDQILVYLWDGTAWQLIVTLDPDNDVYQWYNWDVLAYFDTWTKINGAKLKVQYNRSGSPSTEIIYVRRARLYVDYSAGPILIEVNDSLGLTDAHLRDKTFAVSESIGLSSLMLRNKVFSVVDSLGVSDLSLRDKSFVAFDALDLADSMLSDKTLLAFEAIGLTDIVDVITEIIKVITDEINLVGQMFTNKTLLLYDNIVLSEFIDVITGDNSFISEIISHRRVMGDLYVIFGRFTNTIGHVGGPVKTGLSTVIFATAQHIGPTTIPDAPVFDESFPSSSGDLTLKTVDDGDGIWIACGTA